MLKQITGDKKTPVSLIPLFFYAEMTMEGPGLEARRGAPGKRTGQQSGTAAGI